MIATENPLIYNIPDDLIEEYNNILYVDDEMSNLRVFDSVFSRYYNVYTANSGSAAIKLLRENDIHMIITDQKMPEMTGTDLLEATLGDHPDIIRIILTGFADIQAIIRAINKCSIYKYVTKPYENADMKEIIDKGLDLYNMRQNKYVNGSSEVPESSESVSTLPVNKNLGKDHLSVLNRLSKDSMPKVESFDLFFDHHVLFQKDAAEPFIYYDFVLKEEVGSTQLYSMMIKSDENLLNAAFQLHLKSKFRMLVELMGTHDSPIKLIDQLSESYNLMDVTIPKISFHIIKYDWGEKQVDYACKEPRLKVYAMGEDRFEVVEMSEKSNDVTGYRTFSTVDDRDLMLFMFEYEVQNTSVASEASHNIHQILNNAINSPLEIQKDQIISGLKSIQGDFKDISLIGTLINE